MFTAVRVQGYNCPNKYLISKNTKPLLFVNSLRHASECLSFLNGLITEDELIHKRDKRAVRKLLEAYRQS